MNLKRSSAKYRSLCLISMRLQQSLSPLISWISRSIEVYVTSGNRSLTHRGRVTLMRVANYGNLSLGQMMACRLVDTKPLPERMVEIVNRAPRKKHRWKKLIEIKYISFKKMHLNMSSAKWLPFVSASTYKQIGVLVSKFIYTNICHLVGTLRCLMFNANYLNID